MTAHISNYRNALHDAIDNGAGLIPNYLHAKEVGLLASKYVGHQDILNRTVPKLGSLITAVTACLWEPTIAVSMDTIEPASSSSSVDFHIDSNPRHGISLLVPVEGPRASFYYASQLQIFPDDMPDSRTFEYGPGDIVLLRQHVVVGGETYNQAYHHGTAMESRTMLFCDIISPHLDLP